MTDLLNSAVADAESAKGSADAGGAIKFGPIAVGNIGNVSVVEREMGERKYLYAQFTGTGRPTRMPLAACAALVDALREDEHEDEGEPVAGFAPEEDTPEV